ncbi:hypothetical protein Tco_0036885, partial [Tanacetum coccineum]
RDQGHRIVATGQQSTDMLGRIRELEWDNMRLKDMMYVASQRVAQSERALGARTTARKLEPLMRDRGGQEEVNRNGGNGNGGNRNGNENERGNGYNFRGFVLA